MKKYLPLFLALAFLFSCKTPPKVTAEKAEVEVVEVVEVDPAKTNMKNGFNLVDGIVDVLDTDRGLMLVLANPILFEFRKYNIRPEYDKSVEAVKNFMAANTNFQKMIVEGHTDKVGEEYPVNYVLSNNRSAKTIDALVKLKVARTKLYQSGLGKALLEYTQDDLNRRVDFIIIRNEDDMKKYENFVSKLNLKTNK